MRAMMRLAVVVGTVAIGCAACASDSSPPPAPASSSVAPGPAAPVANASHRAQVVLGAASGDLACESVRLAVASLKGGDSPALITSELETAQRGLADDPNPAATLSIVQIGEAEADLSSAVPVLDKVLRTCTAHLGYKH